MTTIDALIHHLEALAAKATPGPYIYERREAQVTHYGDYDDYISTPSDDEWVSGRPYYPGVPGSEDFAFIAAACNAIPALIAEIRRLRTGLHAIRERDGQQQAEIDGLSGTIASMAETNGVLVKRLAEADESLKATEWMLEKDRATIALLYQHLHSIHRAVHPQSPETLADRLDTVLAILEDELRLDRPDPYEAAETIKGGDDGK